MTTQTIQTYQALIINLYHEGEPHNCTIRAASTGLVLTGFDNITDTTKWLNANGGSIGDVVETDEGYHREARIPSWMYYHLVNVAQQTEKKAA